MFTPLYLPDSQLDLLFPHVVDPHYLWGTARAGFTACYPEHRRRVWIPATGGRRGVDDQRHQERL